VARDAHAARPPVDAGRVEVEAGKVGFASGAVDDEIAFDRLGASSGLQDDPVAGVGPVDRCDCGGGPYGDPGLQAAPDQQIHQVWVESLQGSRPSVDDCRAAAGARRDVGELEGDETAADEQDPGRKRVEVQEVGAVDQVLVAGEFERAWMRTGGDQEVPCLQGSSSDVDAVLVQEPCLAVECVDAVARELAFEVVRHRVGEATLVLHQVVPVDPQRWVFDSLASHQPRAVDDLGTASKNLLGVATTQGAGAAVGLRVDDRDVPALAGALVGCGNAGHAGTDDDEVVGLGHVSAPSGGWASQTSSRRLAGGTAPLTSGGSDARSAPPSGKRAIRQPRRRPHRERPASNWSSTTLRETPGHRVWPVPGCRSRCRGPHGRCDQTRSWSALTHARGRPAVARRWARRPVRPVSGRRDTTGRPPCRRRRIRPRHPRGCWATRETPAAPPPRSTPRDGVSP